MALSHFQNAQKFQVNNGQFINAASGANLTIINNEADPVALILRQYVATGAIFDSAERFPPGKCHPGTRKRINAQIMDWINNPAPAQHILWLYGPAGSGKSAIAQSICESITEFRCPGRKGTSFFFANGVTDRGNAFKLFSTISYQLAIQLPSVRAEINKALIHDPTLPTKSMEIQLQTLIVEPLLVCQNFLSHSPVIIIDGLDECADDEEASTQRHIIALIGKVVADHKLPIRFMIASRPEYWIRDAFNASPLPTITLSLTLQHESDANEDIRTYLTDEFEKIRVKNARIMGSVTLPWPPKEVIDHFVYEASGQFIYASTVIRFVGQSSRFSNPLEQLRIITSPGPQRAPAFSELDRLYSRILAAYPRWETMKRVLGGLLVYGSPQIVRIFLDVAPDELVRVMDALSSLVHISDARAADEMLRRLLDFTSSKVTSQDMVSFCHLSFVEFLKDEARSGPCHVNLDGFRDEITRSLFGLIHRSLEQGYISERHLFLNIDFVTYHWVMYKAAAKSLCDSGIDTLRPLITHMTERLTLLVGFHFGRSMESLAWFAEDMRVLKCAIEAGQQALLQRITGDQLGIEAGQQAFLQRITGGQLGEMRTLLHRFEGAVSLAQNRALCKKLEVTSLLVYLAEFHPDTEPILPQILSTVTSTTDLISTMKLHRHLIHLSCSYIPGRWPSHWTIIWRVKLVDLKALLAKLGHATGLRIQETDEWKTQRVILTRHLLKFVFKMESPRLLEALEEGKEWCLMLKERFFDTRSMADICCRRTFGDPCKCLPLLYFIGNLHLRHNTQQNPQQRNHPHVSNFLVSMICWLNKQLTNLQNLGLLQDHDRFLPQKMTETMNYLLKAFQQDFHMSSIGNLYARGGFSQHEWQSEKVITIKVLPLPQGIYHEDTGIDLASGHQDWHSGVPNWHVLHDELFGNVDGNMEGSSPTIINPCCWHPHLAYRLFNALVKFLYAEAFPMFSITQSWDYQTKPNLRKSFSHILQCLPFAEPTLENLDAVRFIVYLYPQLTESRAATLVSFLPEGIWRSIAEFLQKYPRSLLSSDELDLFERWLFSPGHTDIRDYVTTSLNGSNSDLGLAGMSAENHPGEQPRALISGQKRYSALVPQDERRKRARRDDEST